MPELPEVETVRRGMEPLLAGRRIERLVQNRADIRRALPQEFAASLEGRRFLSLTRRAKYLLATLDSGKVLVIHLGMTGRFFVAAHAREPNIHDHVTFALDNGAQVIFNDARRFGHMDLLDADGIEGDPLFRDLGPEPLDQAFTGKVLLAALAHRKTPLKSALMDQRTVAGLGNIYVCEALFRSRLNPARLAGAVTAKQADLLAGAIKAVLLAAIDSGGSTLRDYVNAQGAAGYFQHHFDVYDREGEVCVNNPKHIIRRITQAGRSTFYCAACQR